MVRMLVVQQFAGSSDVDIIVEFEPGRRLSLVDMVAIQNRLTELLGVRVDLSPAKTLKKPSAARLHSRHLRGRP